MTTLSPIAPSPVEIAFSAAGAVDVVLLLWVAVLLLSGRSKVRLGMSGVVLLVLVPVLGPALVLLHDHRLRRAAAVAAG